MNRLTVKSDQFDFINISCFIKQRNHEDGKIIQLFQKYREEIVRIAKFVMVGVMNTLVYYGIYYLLLQLGFHFAIATTSGYIVGLTNSYIWNKLFVFKAGKKVHSGEVVKFIVVYIVQYLANLGIIYVCVEHIGISAEVAGLIAAVIGPFISYTGLRFLGFRKREG